MTRIFLSVLALLALAVFQPAHAQQTPVPGNAEIEAQAREIGKQLRCVVCQNESIEASNAELAADMRLVVRERLRAGDSEAEIIARMRDRYGDYVLLKPPVQANTIILWAAPILMVLLFLMWWIVSIRKRAGKTVSVPLSESEREQLEQVRKTRS
ncbi:MAG: cytochrome c-type biogenesis protein [Litorimonas sp.]